MATAFSLWLRLHYKALRAGGGGVIQKYGLDPVKKRSKLDEMTITKIQKEADHLPEDQQDILAAYLTMLRRNRDPEWKDTLARRLGLQEPVAWVDLGEIDEN